MNIFVVLLLFLGAATFLELVFSGVRGFAVLFWIFLLIALIYGLNHYTLIDKPETKTS
jgi:hypothetical protein